MSRFVLYAIVALLLMIQTSTSQAAEPSPGKQVEQSFQVDGVQVPYLLYLPKDYKKGGDPLPMMLFLHGRGESNGPLSIVAKWGPPSMVARGDTLTYILISPQCPKKDRWSSETQQQRVLKLLEAMTSKFNGDKRRTYLTGLSMGGYGSWALAASQPHRFAAIAPICGKGDPSQASKMINIPIWAWHGDNDSAVDFQHSVKMVEAIKAAGGQKVRFTTLEGIGHNSWSAAYATPQLFKWFDQHKLPN
ncbi:MAG: dienelactone hydrolase family protein [Planctomycetes bacterium]|nr:dienelactone hydrolase family protein [Planctomycetota bacterium]